ncbi:cerebellin 20 isoform X2 [Hypomesus transpacificus]|uniref:cerebellin 20 isoform X2 n=1 Tax=Hypomesus transpacificus TaxID=137520 RepID=UPI001F0732F5|nr:cerebellin 20 isoform X2 [Hypomesus transpacificus]
MHRAHTIAVPHTRGQSRAWGTVFQEETQEEVGSGQGLYPQPLSLLQSITPSVLLSEIFCLRSPRVNMKVVVFLCVLAVALAQESKYNWNGPSDPNPVDPNTENVCLTDQSSCGCCLMQKQMTRMEQFFNMSLNELEKGLVKTQNVLNNIRASRSAFSVALTDTNQCVGPNPNAVPLIYTHIFINLGNGYNVNTGVFTVPRSGVYSLEEDSATVVLAVQLSAGDTVSVTLPAGCYLCDNQNHYNTFTGFLLYATD